MVGRRFGTDASFIMQGLPEVIEQIYPGAFARERACMWRAVNCCDDLTVVGVVVVLVVAL